MTTPQGLSQANDDSSDALDAEVGRVFDSYLADIEAGKLVDPQSLLAAHPHLADRLQACLEVMDIAASVAGRSEPIDGHGSSSSNLGTTLLEVLCPGDGGPPRILLSQPPDNDPPILARLGQPLSTGRYQVLGEIARGGMGAVFRARDADLGRDLALKVLVRRHRDEPELVRRFVEEAQIGGQLQHPGIVPIYELGAFPDRRPFLAMKLVHGRTLAALLMERPTPTHDLSRFLVVFEQVCQTIAYAHSRRVIHRDLKPSNVMVGNFGEVQVMDWGLAKVLTEGGVADEVKPLIDPELDRIWTVRSGSDSDASRPGTVLGTPAYMPPEQARGEVERLDERSDVFSLGAILCSILTGQPPYVASTHAEARKLAARADLADALGRLAACGAEADLLELARDCLAVNSLARPRDAGEVAKRLRGYLAGVQERLQAAELSRVEAQTRAEGERKRRKLALGLAAAVIGLLIVVGGGGAWWAYERQARAAKVDLALRGSEVLLREAERASDDASKWSAALESINHLPPLLAEARDTATRSRAFDLIETVKEGAAAAAADRVLLDEIVTITSNGGDQTLEQLDSRFMDAFSTRGINPDAMSPEAAGKLIASRPHRAVMAMAYGLDFWAEVRRRLLTRPGAERITAVARVVDPDLWRNSLRTAVSLPDIAERRVALKQLAGKMTEDTPGLSVMLLGMFLFESGDASSAEKVLRIARDREPDDLWLNIYLARSLQRLGRLEEAIRYFFAAQVAQPAYAWELGLALLKKGETSGAVDIFRGLVRRKPDLLGFYLWLAQSLEADGQLREARKVFESGIAVCRNWIVREPNSSRAHFQLATLLANDGNYEEAIMEYKKSIKNKSDYALVHLNLSICLMKKRDFAEAIKENREAILVNPNEDRLHWALGELLSKRLDHDGAIAEFREAIRLNPSLADTHGRLAYALLRKGEYKEAIDEIHEAIRLDPSLEEARKQLVTAERLRGLANRLPAILSGEDQPESDAAAIVAQLFYEQGHFAKATRLWAEAFKADSKLVADRKAAYRYNAACAAALAGSGNGINQQGLDPPTRAKLRIQAREWLTAELAYWAKMLDSDPKTSRNVWKTMKQWKEDPELAGLRDEAEVANLPDAEKTASRLLWEEVKALSNRALSR